MVRLYKLGMTYSEIGREVGVSGERAHYLISKTGVNKLAVKKLSDRKVDENKQQEWYKMYNAKEREMVKELYSSGVKIKDIVDKTGVSRNTVWKIVNNIEDVKHPRKDNEVNTCDERDKEIVKLTELGLTYRDIEGLVYYSREVVGNAIKKVGNVEKNSAKINKIMNKAANGVTLSDIAKEFDIKEEAVLKVIERQYSRNLYSDYRIKELLEKYNIDVKKKVTSDIREVMINMYNEGYGCESIAKKTNFSGTTVRRVLIDSGIYRGYRSKEDNDKIEDEIVKMYVSGCRYKDIQNKLGVTDSKIVYTLYKRSVIKTKGINNEVEKKVTEMYENGESMTVIAEKVGVTLGTVRNILDKNNIVRSKSLRNIRIDDEKRQEIVKMYNEGCKYVDIATKLDVTVGCILSTLRSKGIEFNRRKV